MTTANDISGIKFVFLVILLVLLVGMVEAGSIDWLLMPIGRLMEIIFVELPIKVLELVRS